MKKLLIALSLLAFVPSVVLAEAKRVSIPEKRNDCVTVSVDGKIKRYCINHPHGVIMDNEFFHVCMKYKKELDSHFHWHCFIPSDSGQDDIPVVTTDYFN
jgi:hypothetical protein